MKKTALIAALTAVLCILSSCGRENTASSSQAPAAVTDTTAATADTTETAALTTATEKKTESTTASDTTSEASNDTGDFTGLSGYWFIDGDPGAASIHITKDGRFVSYYADGVAEERGYVKRVLDTEINNYIYCMYKDSGELFQAFADDGETEKTDIYMGNGAFPHYVKLYGEGGLGDDGRGAEESFAGSWNCGRAIIEITDKGEGIFHAKVIWGASASAHAIWDYPLIFENDKLVCSGNGTKSFVELKDGASEAEETVEYTDGSAEFTLEGGHLFWKELKERCADDLRFSRER